MVQNIAEKFNPLNRLHKRHRSQFRLSSITHTHTHIVWQMMCVWWTTDGIAMT